MPALAPHQYVPRWPSERVEMRMQERAHVARIGAACRDLADGIARACDRWEHEWDPRDDALVERMHELLTEADELARRLT
jgi:hypothetical protein